MSKYEINNGIYKTWIVNNYFQYFIKRKERVEVREELITSGNVIGLYSMAIQKRERPFMSLPTEYLLSKSQIPYTLNPLKSVCRDMVNELILRN